MKRKTEPSLEELKKEIEKLKVQKAKKLQIATSMTERNKLMQEINQLNAVQRSPNALKNFGKTFGKGLKTTGKLLWKGITKASRNIDTNAPQVRELSKSMIYKPKPSRQAPMSLDNVLRPKPSKKTYKKKKSKSKSKKARKMVYNQPKQSANSWELPQMKNNYEYGEDFEMDELRANVNISKIIKGKVKRKNTKKKLLWETP